MPRFMSVPVEEVTPKRRMKEPSARARTQQEYQEALQDALNGGQALVVELEEDEKPLTIRNRLKSAGDRLGIEHLVLRRRGDRIVAYQGTEQQEHVAEVLEAQTAG